MSLASKRVLTGRVKTLEESDRIMFEGILTTEEALPREVLERVYKTAVGKVVNYRHVEPTIIPSAFLGEIKDAEIVEIGGKLGVRVKGELIGSTETQKEIARMIEEGVLDGISAEIWYLQDPSGKIVDAHFLGAAITPNPAIPEARIVRVFERLGFEPPEGDVREDTREDEGSTPALEVEKGMSEKAESVDVEALQARIRELEEMVEKLREENEELTVILEAVKPLKDEVERLSEENEELKARLEAAKTLPLRYKIAEKMGDESLVQLLEAVPEDALKALAEKLEAVRVGDRVVVPEPVADSRKWSEDEIRENPEKFLEEWMKTKGKSLYA